jgi:hypothetical protein
VFVLGLGYFTKWREAIGNLAWHVGGESVVAGLCGLFLLGVARSQPRRSSSTGFLRVLVGLTMLVLVLTTGGRLWWRFASQALATGQVHTGSGASQICCSAGEMSEEPELAQRNDERGEPRADLDQGRKDVVELLGMVEGIEGANVRHPAEVLTVVLLPDGLDRRPDALARDGDYGCATRLHWHDRSAPQRAFLPIESTLWMVARGHPGEDRPRADSAVVFVGCAAISGTRRSRTWLEVPQRHPGHEREYVH